MIFNKKVIAFFSLLLTFVFIIQNVSFLNVLHSSALEYYADTESSDSILNRMLDYSYAGYKAGNEEVPSYDGVSTRNENVFLIEWDKDCTDYTSIFLSTIDSAVNYVNESGNVAVILFEPFSYPIASTDSIKIASDNIVLKGTVNSETGERTKLHFTQNVKNDASAEGYFITFGGNPEAPDRKEELYTPFLSNVRFEYNGCSYEYNIPFEKKGAKDIYISSASRFNQNEIRNFEEGTVKIKQTVPSYGLWNSYADDGIFALKTIVYGDADDTDGRYYEICSQLRPVMTDNKYIFEYHTVKGISYVKKSDNRYIYKVTLNEPLKINYIESTMVEFYGASTRLHYKNNGIEDIDIGCDWYAPFSHYNAVRTDQYYGYYGVEFKNVMDSFVKNVNFENTVQGIELDNCFRMTLDNLEFTGNYTHHSVIVECSTDCLVMNVFDSEQVWHSPTATSSSAGTVFLNCEFSNESCPDLHSDTPFATLYDNCSGAFNFKHQGGTLSRMPTHFNDLVFWNFENRRGASETLDIWAFNDTDTLYDNVTYHMSPIFVGIKGYGLTFDEKDLYYYQQDAPDGVPSLYLYQLNNRKTASQDVITHIENTFNKELYKGLDNVKNFEAVNVTMNECTLVWDKVSPPNGTDEVNYVIYIYNDESYSWDSYRDTAIPREEIYYDEKTGKYSTTFAFFAPESERVMSIRAYISRGDYNIYSGFASPVTVKNLPVPAVTGLKYTEKSEKNITLQWNPIPNTTGSAFYHIYCYNEQKGSWEKVQNEGVYETEYTVSGLDFGEIVRYKIQGALQYNDEEIFNGPISDEEICVCATPKVTGLTVIDRSENSYTLVWDKAEDEDVGYFISKYDKILDSWNEINTEPIYDNKYTVTGAVYGEETSYRVSSAYERNGKIFKSDLTSEIKASAVPRITGYKVINNEINGFTVTWNGIWHPEDCDVYYVLYKYDNISGKYLSYRSTDTSTDLIYDGATDTYSYKFSFYSPGSVTKFKVAPYIIDRDGNIVYGDDSEVVEAKALDVPKATGLTVLSRDDNGCRIGWDKYNIRNMYYRVYTVNDDGSTELITKTPVTQNSFYITDLEYGKERKFAVSYYYYINGEYFEGELSEPINVWTLPKVSGFKVSELNMYSYTLSWDKYENDYGDVWYQLYQYNDKSEIWEEFGRQISGNRINIEDSFGVGRKYKVAILLDDGENVYIGGMSDEISVAAMPNVTGFNVVDEQVNGYTLVWDKLTAPNGKNIYYSLEQYNSLTGTWSSYRDSSSANDIHYNEQTNQYYIKLYFYNPGSVTKYRIRSYYVNLLSESEAKKVFGEYSNTVSAKSLDVPKVTGLNAVSPDGNRCILFWNPYTDVNNMLYKVYAFSDELQQYIPVGEPISVSQYIVENLESDDVVPYKVSMCYYLNGTYFEGELSDCVYVGGKKTPQKDIYVFKIYDTGIANISLGVKVHTDSATTLYNGKVFVPVRAVSAAVGVNDLKYDAVTGAITFTGFSGYRVKITVGSSDCILTASDGTELHINISAPIINNGSTMLPLRDMANLTGGMIKFDSSGYVIASADAIDDSKISAYITAYENI